MIVVKLPDLHKLQKPTRRWPTGTKPVCLACKMAFDTFSQLRRHRAECPEKEQDR